MKLNTFMSIAAIVAFLFGLAFILVPAQTMSMYGVTLDIAGQYVGRYWGSTLLGVAVLTWLAKKADQKEKAMRAIILGDFILCVTGFVVSLFDKFYGGGNYLTWSTVIIYFLLAVGFGYFQFRKSTGT